jgi:8-oxo-dGTP pyrophosphatase MutT (NUDIX family)
MNSKTENPWKTKSIETKYENDWIRVEHHNVVNPSGNDSIYGKVRFKNIAIGIIPLDENNNTWLVGQYRYPLQAYSWEIPEGGGLHHDEPLASAKRELKEETGMEAEHWELIQKMHISNSVTDEYGLVYIATGLHFGESNPTETEELWVKKIPFQKAFEMVMNGEITDSLSVAGILKAKHLLDL